MARARARVMVTVSVRVGARTSWYKMKILEILRKYWRIMFRFTSGQG